MEEAFDFVAVGLKQAFPTLSDQVLGQRLAELVREQLVEKTAVADTIPPQIRYTPTPKGRALLTIIDALQHWGQQDWSSDQPRGKLAYLLLGITRTPVPLRRIA
ncbi:winged helix-turn-helix transcriptional regulator [Hymenobacter bucti]|uniref:winged helix-turn-helix transcriptional regulator n=1 Tax=Hymenobacter bucti TaxID=1844114 RepID=UPI003628D6F7